MKTVPQITFPGLKGTSLTLTEDGKASPLTSLALFRIAALRGPGQASRAEVTPLIWRKCIKAFDAIEAAGRGGQGLSLGHVGVKGREVGGGERVVDGHEAHGQLVLGMWPCTRPTNLLGTLDWLFQLMGKLSSMAGSGWAYLQK